MTTVFLFWIPPVYKYSFWMAILFFVGGYYFAVFPPKEKRNFTERAVRLSTMIFITALAALSYCALRHFQ